MWSTPDLSDISLVIKGLLDKAVATSTLGHVSKIKVTLDSPEITRTKSDLCYLTVYLLHIGRDPYWRNTPMTGPRPQLNNAQPLSLNLSYILTAFCDKDPVLEQRAMSIALQTIQSNPIMNAATTPQDPLWTKVPEGEFVISIEADTVMEMSNLWQAFTVPIRLSALIRASVIFIEPPAPVAPLYPPPATTNLAVAPVPTKASAISIAGPIVAQTAPPVLFAAYSQQTPPLPPNSLAPTSAFPLGPPIAVAAPNHSNLILLGAGLDQPDAANIYLSTPGGILWDVTGWRQNIAGGELQLALPAAYADPAITPPPAALPFPGVFQLSVGSAGNPASVPIPIAIAPRVDITATPPLLKQIAGTYTLTGAGFAPSDAVSLALGPNFLTYTTGALNAGSFAIDAAGETITFKANSLLATGTYPLLLAVNGIAASIGWLVAVP